MSKPCFYPKCDGGPQTGFCHVECGVNYRIRHEFAAKRVDVLNQRIRRNLTILEEDGNLLILTDRPGTRVKDRIRLDRQARKRWLAEFDDLIGWPE